MFVNRQRLNRFVTLALLKPEQRFVLQKMSQMVMHSSTDDEESSSYSSTEDNAIIKRFTSKVVQETNPLSTQLMRIYKTQIKNRKERHAKQSIDIPIGNDILDQIPRSDIPELDAAVAEKQANDLMLAMTRNTDKIFELSEPESSSLQTESIQPEPVEEPFENEEPLNDEEFEQHVESVRRLVYVEPVPIRIEPVEDLTQWKKKQEKLAESKVIAAPILRKSSMSPSIGRSQNRKAERKKVTISATALD